MKTKLLYALALMLATQFSYAQTVISTSFDDYTLGNLAGQDNWVMNEDGVAAVVTTTDYVNSGTQGIKFGTSETATISVEHLAYNDETTGLSTTVYADFYIKVLTLTSDESINIAGYDLLPDGDRRAFMFDINTSGQLRVYDGGTKVTVPAELYSLEDWIRISVSLDFATATYEAAVNGTILDGTEDGTLDFRESYSPIEKGRETDTKEYHSLRIYYEDDIADLALDDIYIGTTAIADIDFSAPSIDRTVEITQPANATITVSPDKENYEAGEDITVEVTNVSDHYIFESWTGSFNSTENPYTFTIEGNVSLGASIIVDESDPPNSYTIDITQPTGGTITVSPESGPYYEGSEVTFKVTPSIGYTFSSWTGITGSTEEETIVIDQDLNVTAVLTEGSYSERIVNVSTTSEFENALGDIQPGDRIIVADGTYDGIGKSMKNLGGTSTWPVTVEAANTGMAKIVGDGQFTLTNCSYITFKGFDFDVEVYTLFKLTSSNNIRISQNVFKNAGNNGSKLILIGDIWEATSSSSHHNRIDHNLFDGKSDAGAWLVIDGSHGGTPQVSQYDRIDHNHFRNNGPRVTNEKETIRIGLSNLSLSSAFCTVENNLFEACDGDPEIISVKSCDNYIRNNTFIKSLGTVSLRHGNRTEVSGNYFLGQGKTAVFEDKTIGCGGVRVYGKDHKIFNNYFEGLTGSLWDAACTLTQGDATNNNVTNSSDLTKHYLVENLEFTHNTLVNNNSDIEIGYRDDWGKAPVNCLIANNIIVQDTNPVTKVHKAGTEDDITFADNIIYTTGDATWGDIAFAASEATNVNPLLVSSDCRGNDGNCPATVPNAIFKLTSGSPAINATTNQTFSYVTSDSEGQSSVGVRDIGADEYNTSATITNGVLSASHVGPDAIIFEETLNENYDENDVTDEDDTTNDDETVDGQTITTVNPNQPVIKLYPNPFKESINFEVEQTAHVLIFNLSGHQIGELNIEKQAEWKAPQRGLYIAHIFQNNTKHVLKLVAE
ncbi:MAG: chondroitinase-B domain-containing protein [Reichenbachiella sp.]|uniref:chondroitinase-B domain-containing protein n=1 Tax=Reichenbachiella sp. TaxID=2184521 RepID=UPI00329A485D